MKFATRLRLDLESQHHDKYFHESRKMKFTMTLLFLMNPCFLLAAPYPLTGSSFFLNNKLNPYLWPFKIDLNLQRSTYEIDLSQNDSEKWSVKSLDKELQIFIRLKKLSSKEDYDKSLKNWIREYEKSGFKIMGQQIPTKNAENGWIHLQDAQSDKQLVQYFRYQNRTWIYFNCLGNKEKLASLKQSCAYLSSILIFR